MKKVPPPVVILQPPAPPPGLAADVVASGLPVHPEDRVRLFSADQWERFVQEWVDSLRDEYELVERCGGAGDMGRDVIATVKGGNGAWDNYQCKHYQKALAPGDVWIELGKLAYYTLKSDYSYPRAYFFVAPQGVGPTLSNLLKKPHALRDGLLANWDKACRTEIVECDATMKAHIASLDFSIFQTKPLLRIIEGHAKTRWYAARFGGGLPLRPEPLAPPSVPAANEALFVGELRRRPEGWLLVHVPGWDTATVARLVERLDHVPVIHFGDLDPNGVRILQHLRGLRPDLRWFVPEFWAELLDTKGLPGAWPDDLDLDLGEAPALVRDLATRGLWLEQEPLSVDPRTSAALEAML